MEQRHYDLNYYARKLMTREGFLGLTMAAMAGAVGLVISIPIVGYILSPVINQPKNVWRNVRLEAPDGTLGEVVRVDTIPLGRTQRVTYKGASPLAWAGSTGKLASWLRRTGPEEFTAFSINCTHLGCPVEYLQGGHLFLCPCHGSVFNDDGTVASGPAARPLTRYPVRVRAGRVQILTEPLPLRF
jgi:menaquinol-cytochrome c reductase iron-sulfur subunit